MVTRGILVRMNVRPVRRRRNRSGLAAGTSRRGVTLAESVAAAALLSRIAAGLLPRITRSADLREDAWSHATAVTEVANLMERIALLRDDGQLDPSELQGLAVSEWASKELPEHELAIRLTDESDEIPDQRLTVALTWRDSSGGRSAPVSATAFLYGGAR